MWLNNIPTSTGVSLQWSPCKLILRHHLDFKKHCKAPFGAYCEAHEENDPTKGMDTCGTPSIYCGPTGNLRGTNHFFSLVTGKLIKRCHLTKLPVPQLVIDWVAHFAKATPTPQESNLIFEDCHHCPYDWSEDYDILGSDTTPMAPYPDLPAKMPGLQLDGLHCPSSQTTSSSNNDPDWE